MRGDRFFRRVHRKLTGILEVRELFVAEDTELEVLDKALADFEGNAAICTSDAKTLDRLEKEFAVGGESGLTLAQRRSVVLAALRGRGVTTPELVRNMALAFENGDVEVLESPDKPYVVTIKFISAYGVPPRLNDFYRALRTIMPAHLDIDYIFRFMTWNEFDGYGKTWDQWDALGLSWNDFEAYSEGGR